MCCSAKQTEHREWAARGTGGHGWFFCCCCCSWLGVSLCTTQSIQEWNILLSLCQNKHADDPLEDFLSCIYFPMLFYLVCLLEKETFFVWSALSRQAVKSKGRISSKLVTYQCAEAPVTAKYILASGYCHCQACAAAFGDQLRCWLW